MSNQIKRPYPDNWPWGTPHKHPEGDTPPPFEGFNPEYPEEGSVVSNLAYSIREAKRALNSVVSVPAVFSCDVEDGDIAIPLPCGDSCDVNCDELLKTLRDLGQIPDAIWVPAFRTSTDSQVSTLSAVDPTTYDPPFYGVAYTRLKRVMVGPVVAHPRFKFHTGDKIYAGKDGDLTTTPNDHMVGVCLAPGSVYLNQYASSLKEALTDLYDNVIADTITKVEQEGLDGDNIGVTTDGATTERPLEVRFGDWVNVKDFGAKGDGVTNDTAAFNAAIAHAQELGSNVCLFIPVGNYLVQTLPNVPCYGPGSVKFSSYTYSPFELLFKINGAIQRDTNGRFKIDFTKMSETDLAALIKQLLPTTGGGLTTDENGKLVLDLSLMTEEQIRQLIQDMLPETGGGLTTDEDGKLIVDFSQMPKDELEELIKSLLPTTGGNLETDDSGKLVVKVEELIQDGGGLSVDDDGKLFVDFDSMPTDKFEAMLKSIRVPIWLTSNKSFYVNQVTGSDTLDTGRGESSSKPFKTIQACVNYVTDNYNVSRYSVYINVAAGTYSERLSLSSYSRTTGLIYIIGEDGTIIDLVNSNTVFISIGYWYLQNLTIRCSLTDEISEIMSGYTLRTPLQVENNAIVYIIKCTLEIVSSITLTTLPQSLELAVISVQGASVVFSASLGHSAMILPDSMPVTSSLVRRFIRMLTDGSVIVNGNYNSQDYAKCECSGACEEFILVRAAKFTRQGTPAYKFIFSVIDSKSVTGKRYNIDNGGTCETVSGGAEYFPGDTAGSVDSTTYSWYK